MSSGTGCATRNEPSKGTKPSAARAPKSPRTLTIEPTARSRRRLAWRRSGTRGDRVLSMIARKRSFCVISHARAVAAERADSARFETAEHDAVVSVAVLRIRRPGRAPAARNQLTPARQAADERQRLPSEQAPISGRVQVEAPRRRARPAPVRNSPRPGAAAAARSSRRRRRSDRRRGPDGRPARPRRRKNETARSAPSAGKARLSCRSISAVHARSRIGAAGEHGHRCGRRAAGPFVAQAATIERKAGEAEPLELAPDAGFEPRQVERLRQRDDVHGVVRMHFAPAHHRRLEQVEPAPHSAPPGLDRGAARPDQALRLDAPMLLDAVPDVRRVHDVGAVDVRPFGQRGRAAAGS